MAKIDDVIEAATRLVADQGIIGRALVIGPKAASKMATAAGLEPAVDGQAIWDGYAHDFEQTDLFIRRLIGVTNLVTSARGWAGVMADLGAGINKAIWRTLGY